MRVPVLLAAAITLGTADAWWWTKKTTPPPTAAPTTTPLPTTTTLSPTTTLPTTTLSPTTAVPQTTARASTSGRVTTTTRAPTTSRMSLPSTTSARQANPSTGGPTPSPPAFGIKGNAKAVGQGTVVKGVVNATTLAPNATIHSTNGTWTNRTNTSTVQNTITAPPTPSKTSNATTTATPTTQPTNTRALNTTTIPSHVNASSHANSTGAATHDGGNTITFPKPSTTRANNTIAPLVNSLNGTVSFPNATNASNSTNATASVAEDVITAPPTTQVVSTTSRPSASSVVSRSVGAAVKNTQNITRAINSTTVTNSTNATTTAQANVITAPPQSTVFVKNSTNATSDSLQDVITSPPQNATTAPRTTNPTTTAAPTAAPTRPPLTPLPEIAVPDVALNWYPCSMTTSDSAATVDSNAPTAECADVYVPLCHPGICTTDAGYTTVFVKRLRAKSWTANTPVVWFVPGGPGAPSTTLEDAIVQVYQQANAAIDVYTLDPRGSGRSPLLDCPHGDVESLSACLQSIQSTYGAEAAPAVYSVTSAAADLRWILHSTLFANSDVFVYGQSFGTYIVERLMHLAPRNVKGYVLDGVQSEIFNADAGPYFSNWGRDVGPVVSSFWAACDADAFCSDRLGPKSEDTFHQVLQALDANATPCAQALAPLAKAAGFAATSELVGHQLYEWLQDRELRAFVPPAVYRLNRCNVIDAKWATSWLSTAIDASTLTASELKTAGPYLANNGGYSRVAYDTVVFSELWQTSPSSPSAAQLTDWARESKLSQGYELQATQQVANYCLYAGKNSDATCAGRPSVNFSYARDVYWNQTAAIPSGASVLLLAGGLDLQTPAKYAREEFDSLGGDNKLLLEFPTSAHGILSHSIVTVSGDDIEDLVDCGTNVLVSYVQHRGSLAATDVGCVAHVQPLTFNAYDTDVASVVFGQPNAYADDLDDSLLLAASQVSAGRLWWLGVAGAMGAGVVAVFVQVQRRRRARRHTYAPVATVHVDTYGSVAN